MFDFLFPKDTFHQELSNFIFTNSPDAYCVIREGRVIAFNAAFSTVMRQPSEELMGLTPPEFSPEFQFGGKRSDELAGEYIGKAMRDGHCRFEWEIRRRDDSRFPVMVTLMRWQRQNETLLIFVWQDIEEMVRLREEEKARQIRVAQEIKEDQFAISALSDGLKTLARGDLTGRIDTPFSAKTDGLRQNFNAATEQLKQLIEEVTSTSTTILQSCREISSATSDLATRTERQAASVEEASGALSQIVTNVSDAAGFARNAKNTVDLATTDSNKAQAVVTKAISAMEDIARSSGEIGKIIGVIDEIAFQTNLLALNAGVEAARAGEAGKGFAVVAQEVRELAQRSATAAKEIRSLIASSNQQVSTGVNLVGETSGALGRIVAHIGDIGTVVQKIEQSTHEQEASIREIDTVIHQVDQATQKNAAMVEQTAAATHTMTTDLTDVTHSLAGFRIAEENNRPQRFAA